MLGFPRHLPALTKLIGVGAMQRGRTHRLRLPLTFLLSAAALLLMISLTLPSALGTGSLPAPDNLTASIDSDGIDLSWDAPTVEDGQDPPTGYDVQMRTRSDAGLGDWDTIAEDETGTEYTSTELLHGGRQYDFSVIAVYSATTQSGRSDSVTVTAPTVGTPQSLTKSRTDDGIDLTWTAPTLSWDDSPVSLSGYVIVRVSWYRVAHPTLGQDYQTEDLASLGSDTLTYTDETTIAEKSYGYSIYAVYGYVRGATQNGDSTFLEGVGE